MRAVVVLIAACAPPPATARESAPRPPPAADPEPARLARAQAEAGDARVYTACLARACDGPGAAAWRIGDGERALLVGDMHRGVLLRGTMYRVVDGAVEQLAIDMDGGRGVLQRPGYTIQGQLDDHPIPHLHTAIVRFATGESTPVRWRDGVTWLPPHAIDPAAHHDTFAAGMDGELVLAALLASDLRPGQLDSHVTVAHVDTVPPLVVLVERRPPATYVVGHGLVVGGDGALVARLRDGASGDGTLELEGPGGARGPLSIAQREVIATPFEPHPRRAWRELLAHRRARIAADLDELAELHAAVRTDHAFATWQRARGLLADALAAADQVLAALPIAEAGRRAELLELRVRLVRTAAQAELARAALDVCTTDDVAALDDILALVEVGDVRAASARL